MSANACRKKYSRADLSGSPPRATKASIVSNSSSSSFRKKWARQPVPALVKASSRSCSRTGALDLQILNPWSPNSTVDIILHVGPGRRLAAFRKHGGTLQTQSHPFWEQKETYSRGSAFADSRLSRCFLLQCSRNASEGDPARKTRKLPFDAGAGAHLRPHLP